MLQALGTKRFRFLQKKSKKISCLCTFKRTCHTQDLSKNTQLLANVNYSCLCSLHFCLEPCGMESSQMPLPGCWIYDTYFFKDKFKALNTLLNSAEYTITRKREFLFPCLQILLEHSTRWTLCNHQYPTQPLCGVRSSWEGWARIFKRMITLFLLGS